MAQFLDSSCMNFFRCSCVILDEMIFYRLETVYNLGLLRSPMKQSLSGLHPHGLTLTELFGEGRGPYGVHSYRLPPGSEWLGFMKTVSPLSSVKICFQCASGTLSWKFPWEWLHLLGSNSDSTKLYFPLFLRNKGIMYWCFFI